MVDGNNERPAPKQLIEISEHVRLWLADLDPEDIARFKKWNAFITWAETTGRLGKGFVLVAVAVFTTSLAIAQGWDWLRAKFWG